MTDWDRLSEWLAAAIVASLTWVSGSVSLELPRPAAPSPAPADERLMIGWVQSTDQPPIEQVGEGTGDDVEPLDAGAPAAGSAPGDDPEALNAGSPQTVQSDDVETLDQGTAATTADATGVPLAAAPVSDATTSNVATEPTLSEATGPWLPEGFGTGQVFAVAGRGDAPVGLADCHVGAVTGRAYVGLDCGEDEGTSFVGHARSLEAFPFVLEAEFPFEGDEAFFTDPNFPFGDDDELALAASGDDRSSTGIFVSARGDQRERDDEASSAPAVETGGESTVSFAQRAREREPRVRVEDRSRKSEGDRKRAGGETERGAANVESQQQDRRGGGQGDRPKSERNEKDSKSKKSKDKKPTKDRAERKDKKDNRDR